MVLNALAQAFFDLKEHHRAERYLRESAAAQPQQKHAWALLANLLLLAQRHQDAIVALRSLLGVSQSVLATDVSPDEAVMQMKLGMCELLTHDADNAVAHLSAALAADTLTVEARATAKRYRGMAERMLEAKKG